MKRLIKYISFILSVPMLFIGCEKAETALPPREISPEVAEVAAHYREILSNAPDGWLFGYKPENYEDTVYARLAFGDEQHLEIIAGYRGFHTLQPDAGYDFEGKYTPVMVFSDNSIYAELARSFNGSQKFKISYQEDGAYFELVRADGYDNHTFVLEKANADNMAEVTAQVDDILAQIAFEEEQARLSEETRLKVKALAELESDFFFYNLKTAGFSAGITGLDTASRTLSLLYKETVTAAPTSVTVNYSIYPKGIALNPSIAYGNTVVDSIELGNMEGPILQVINAGNAGAGAMGYMHEAPYVYTNTANRSETVADVLYYNSRQASNLMYTNFPDSLYSDAVLVQREQLRQVVTDVLGQYTETRFNLQLYFPSTAIPSTNSMSLQLTARNAANTGNTFMALYLSLDEEELQHNILKYTLNGNISANVADIREEYEDFFHQLFPEEGVTVVPYRVGATTRFKLVSRQDSRYWVNYIHNLAAPRSVIFD